MGGGDHHATCPRQHCVPLRDCAEYGGICGWKKGEGSWGERWREKKRGEKHAISLTFSSDWVGRTKRKKVYVISTMKRPTPLEHYLYAGEWESEEKEKFAIVRQCVRRRQEKRLREESN